jgi:hypothetical protein
MPEAPLPVLEQIGHGARRLVGTAHGPKASLPGNPPENPVVVDLKHFLESAVINLRRPILMAGNVLGYLSF